MGIWNQNLGAWIKNLRIWNKNLGGWNRNLQVKNLFFPIIIYKVTQLSRFFKVLENIVKLSIIFIHHYLKEIILDFNIL